MGGGCQRCLGWGAVAMDKAYDSSAIHQFLAMQGIESVIPPKTNRTEAIHHDAQKYKLREKVERFFNKLKQFGGSPLRRARLQTAQSLSRMSRAIPGCY